jgi:hypothetical protein
MIISGFELISENGLEVFRQLLLKEVNHIYFKGGTFRPFNQTNLITCESFIGLRCISMEKDLQLMCEFGETDDFDFTTKCYFNLSHDHSDKTYYYSLTLPYTDCFFNCCIS